MSKYNEMLKMKEAEIEAQRTKNTIDLGTTDDLQEPVVMQKATILADDVAQAQLPSRGTIFLGIAAAALLLLALFLFWRPGSHAPTAAAPLQNAPLAPQEKAASKADTQHTADAQEQQVMGSETSSTAGGAPLPTPADPALIEDELRQFLANWTAAWQVSAGSDGNIAAYLFFYSDNFKADGLDKEGWMKHKALRNRNKAWIEVALSEVTMNIDKDGLHATIHFNQEYKSPNYSDSSKKVLSLAKDKFDWRILSEKSVR